MDAIKLTLVPLGGCRGINGSSFLLGNNSTSLLLDAGQGGIPLKLEILKRVKPDAIFITHAHLDHIGSLPLIHQEFPDIPVFLTPITSRWFKLLPSLKYLLSESVNERFLISLKYSAR